MRRMIIAGNWKMYKTLEETLVFFDELSSWEKDFRHENQILIFPPNLYTMSCLEKTRGNDIDIGVQNIYFKDFGAYTGEISPPMLTSIGCKYALVGHSERRHIFAENDEEINRKILSLLKHKKHIVFCVGEKENEREDGYTEQVLTNQLRYGLGDVGEKDMQQITIAYEPVWAIGTGKTATPEIAQDAHAFIRNWLKDNYSSHVANKARILYGGSVKVANCEGLLIQPDIDGALIGGASLKINDFIEIIKKGEEVANRKDQ
ncbi:MAG TPA: triose-phosphate isomerase [Candidatus Cloacimonetes bacterium]|nr:triose-phosphate isomerase [Candidatus Cloacimonadota bacterium]HEX37571.1 triose-phosphate isomerase [Candidatus Cloacimonadota bacterium]